MIDNIKYLEEIQKSMSDTLLEYRVSGFSTINFEENLRCLI